MVDQKVKQIDKKVLEIEEKNWKHMSSWKQFLKLSTEGIAAFIL